MTGKTEASLIARLNRTGEKLRRLRDADRAFSVFGSDSHAYRLGPPLSGAALSDCGERLGVQLPTEYRLFVSRIGHGGAGPFCGLFSLDGQDSEDITDLAQICQPFRWVQAFNPYEREDPCSQEDVWCDREVERGAAPGDPPHSGRPVHLSLRLRRPVLSERQGAVRR